VESTAIAAPDAKGRLRRRQTHTQRRADYSLAATELAGRVTRFVDHTCDVATGSWGLTEPTISAATPRLESALQQGALRASLRLLLRRRVTAQPGQLVLPGNPRRRSPCGPTADGVTAVGGTSLNRRATGKARRRLALGDIAPRATHGHRYTSPPRLVLGGLRRRLSTFYAEPAYQRSAATDTLATPRNRPGWARRPRHLPNPEQLADRYTGAITTGLRHGPQSRRTSGSSPLFRLRSGRDPGLRHLLGFAKPALYRAAARAARDPYVKVTRRTRRRLWRASWGQ